MADRPPLPFITCDDAGRYTVTEEATALLSSITEPVAVVAVAGLYRTGKSFLLNRLVGRQTGFTVGPTVEACTKGLWLYGRPMPVTLGDGTTCQVLFVDTEGFGASRATQDSDSRLFSLATLLCSLLIYNSVGAINEEAVTNVAFIADLTKHIQMRATAAPSSAGAGAGSSAADDVSNTAQLPEFFPAFLWVLRDFVLDLKDEDGLPMTPRDYLEASLQEKAGFTTEQQQRNRVRRALTRFFRRRDCRTLVRPVTDETTLQELDKQDFEALRPEFRTAVEELRGHVLHTMLRPKTLFGRQVTGRMLAGLAVAYTTAINSNVVPSIGDAWSDVAKAECTTAMSKALVEFRRGLSTDAAAKDLPLSEEMLEELYHRVRTQALDTYDKQAVGAAAASIRKELKHKLRVAYDALLQANEEASTKQCAALLTRLSHDTIECHLEGGGHAYQDGSQFGTDLAAVVTEYDAQATGPAKLPQLIAFVTGFVGDVVARVTRRAAAEAAAKQAELEAEVAASATARQAVEGRLAAAQSELADATSQVTAVTADRARFEMEAQVAQETVTALRKKLRAAEVTQRRLQDELQVAQEDTADAHRQQQLLVAKLDARSAEVTALHTQVEQLQVSETEAQAAAVRSRSEASAMTARVEELEAEVESLSATAAAATASARAAATVAASARRVEAASPAVGAAGAAPPAASPARPPPPAAVSGWGDTTGLEDVDSGDDGEEAAAIAAPRVGARRPVDGDSDASDGGPQQPPEWTRQRRPPKSARSPTITQRPATAREAGVADKGGGSCCCVVS